MTKLVNGNVNSGWGRFIYGFSGGTPNSVVSVPWVGLSSDPTAYSTTIQIDFVAAYFKMTSSDYLVILNGGTGKLENFQKIDTSAGGNFGGLVGTTSDRNSFWSMFKFQNLSPGGNTNIANYRIFVAYEDDATVASLSAQLESRSTTALQKTMTNVNSYRYGVIALDFLEDKVYFGGSKIYSAGSNSGFAPMIGWATASSLVVDQAWQMNVDDSKQDNFRH